MSNHQTETDIVVVFGSVDDQTCQYLLDAMTVKGLDPKIVRIDDSASEQALENDMSITEESIIEHFFQDTPISAVKAYIAPYEAPDMPTHQLDYIEKWGWIIEMFDENVAGYEAEIRMSDGPQFLVGYGFGIVLPRDALEDWQLMQFKED